MRNTSIIFLSLFISVNVSFANDELSSLKILELEKGVYLHTSFQIVKGFGLVDSNGLIVVDHNDAYIIDTPWTKNDTEQLVNWLKERNLNIKGSISTHFHADRTAGIGLLNSKSIPTYASKLTNDLLKRAGKPQAKNFFDNTSFWLLKDQIEVFYPGGGHSPDNVVVWLAKHRILFGGCLVRAKETKNLGNVSDAVIEAWPSSVEKLESKYRNARFVVPGHGNVGNVSLLEHTRKLAATTSNK